MMIDICIRLRRAIHLNDPLLVRRIIQNNPHALRNPDFGDKSNTSLHIACKLGHVEIARLLIDAGHEDEGISLNTDFETPLMLACEAQKIDVAKLLIAGFPRCVPWANKFGMDALMLSSRNGTLPLLPLLLTTNPPSSPTAHDKDGNTALHYASASGELKALRLLLQFGASPMAQNAYSWTPIAYSATAAAEAYSKQLVVEFERRRVEVQREQREKEMRRAAGVRLVTTNSGEGLGGRNEGIQNDGRSASAMGFRDGPPQIGVDWSPVTPFERNAMTPTEGPRGADMGWPLVGITRRRAESGE